MEIFSACLVPLKCHVTKDEEKHTAFKMLINIFDSQTNLNISKKNKTCGYACAIAIIFVAYVMK